jgi:hypothetical protein
MEISITTAILESIFTHATTGARLANLLDNGIPVVDALTKSIDEIGRTLAGLLGNPHPIAAPVPSALSTFALDVMPDAVPVHVAPDAPAASRTISIAIDDSTRHELVRLSDPDERGIAFADDDTTQPHIALSGGAR